MIYAHDQQAALIARLRAQVADRDAQIAQLLARIAQLTATKEARP